MFRILWILFSFKTNTSEVLNKGTPKWETWQTWSSFLALVQRNFMSWLGKVPHFHQWYKHLIVNRAFLFNFLVLYRQWRVHGWHQEMGFVPASTQTNKSSSLRSLFHSHSLFLVQTIHFMGQSRAIFLTVSWTSRPYYHKDILLNYSINLFFL